jgi:CheY-like chemotaxis protein
VLGEQAEVRASQPSERGMPLLERVLNYPDRRVQMAAAEALLRIKLPTPPVAPGRVVEVLRRALAGDAQPKVLVADQSPDRGNLIGKTVEEAKYGFVLARTGRQVMQRLAEAADIDLLLIDSEIADPQLPYLLSQLRADVFAGLLPIIVLAPENRVHPLERLVERYRNVWIVPAAADPKDLKRLITARITEVMGKPLTEAERREYARSALEWLGRLGRGEVAGYDIRPAKTAILAALQAPELASLAVDAAGLLPGRDPQAALADVVLRGKPEDLCSRAAIELCRHIQHNGLVLPAEKIQRIEQLYESATDAKVKADVARVIGSLHQNPTQTGKRLLGFQPDVESPAVLPVKPKEDKEQKDDKDSKDDK